MSAQLQPDEDHRSRKRLTLKEAATKVGVSTATLRRRIKDGSLRAYQTLGKFGSQWEIQPDDLDTLTFVAGETILDVEDHDEGEAPPRHNNPEHPDARSPFTEEDAEVVDEAPSEVALLPAGPTLEQQALHQAGYWQGRWQEARDRVLELEQQIHIQSLPLAQLSQQAESSQAAEQLARAETEQLKAQVLELMTQKSKVEQHLDLSESALQKELQKSWWQRLFGFR